MSQQTNTSQEPQQATSSTETQSVGVNTSLAVNICAVCLCICFFLPWIGFFGTASGFDLAKTGGKALILWSIPIFSVITILINVITKNRIRIVAQFTGTFPFVGLAYGLYHLKIDFMRILAIGGYLSLILGLALFILPFRRK
jgi:hypothetical protein